MQSRTTESHPRYDTLETPPNTKSSATATIPPFSTLAWLSLDSFLLPLVCERFVARPLRYRECIPCTYQPSNVFRFGPPARSRRLPPRARTHHLYGGSVVRARRGCVPTAPQCLSTLASLGHIPMLSPFQLRYDARGACSGIAGYGDNRSMRATAPLPVPSLQEKHKSTVGYLLVQNRTDH